MQNVTATSGPPRLRSPGVVIVAALLVVVGLGGCTKDDPTVPSPSGSSESESPAPVATASSNEGTADVGGRDLYFSCSGSGSPTVLMEAGLTGDHRTWDRVVPDLAAANRVCVYDRANVGQSDPAELPRTAQDAVDDLASLVAETGEEGPFVLVGFSFGGLISQIYASEHPDEIAGLVLVESTHAAEDQVFAKHLTKQQRAEDTEAIQANPEFDVIASLEEGRAMAKLPDVPLVVVTATGSPEWPPGWDQETFDQLRVELQEDLVNLTPRGQQMFADGSGHHVPSERPDLVVEAVRLVLEAI